VTPERWRQISAIFNAAKQRSPADRAAYVVEASRGDDALGRDVNSLLRAHQDGAGFGSSPLMQSGQLPSGSSFCGYRIESLLGAGGMGEVYRARDTKLDRSVAIKILPESFAQDPERLARFEREAKTLAALNHPNIAIIHGFEEEQGIQTLVMELIEGPTLAERMALRAIPVDEALAIAKQIAEALEVAHEHGIIHRDLKPANIKVRPDGTVKILDFGLAKALKPTSAKPNDAIVSPTIASPARLTAVGVLLGTAAYMSPEQAKGQAADKRGDVWAFGCVLYEMLTGRRCFDGENIAETLAFVLTKEPDWSALPATTPPLISTLLRRCLDKDRRTRVGDLSAASFAIGEARALGAAAVGPSPVISGRSIPFWRRLATYSVPALIAGLAMAGGGLWFAMRPAPLRVSRLAIATTPATALTINGNDRDLAIRPDGSTVVYVGNNGTELFVRPLDALEPMSIFTGAPRAPFVSPDGQWVGFIDTGTILKKVAITGGPAVTITTLDGNSRGAAWTEDDTIVFATTSSTGLQQVSAAGGPVTVLTRPDSARGEADHGWPEALDGRTMLFTIWPVKGGVDAAEIAVLDRQSGTHSVVMRGSHAHYVKSGHLVYLADNTLRAVAFDPRTQQTRGTPVPIVPHVVSTTSALAGGVDAVVAANGALAYIRGPGNSGRPRTLVWLDREGRESPVPSPSRAYVHPRVSPVSPEGERIVVSSQDEEVDLWLWNVTRSTLTRLTTAPGVDYYPVWTPDSKRVIFNSAREGVNNLFWQAADGSGAVERLTRSPNPQASTGISPDGTRLVFFETSPTTGDDILQVELTGTHRVTPLVQSRFAERNGVISPDGRWLAYEANDSGQFEIWVRPYPEVNSGRWQVSTGGGTRPLWSPGGEELFHMSPAGAIMRVGVERGTAWAAATPTTIVKAGIATGLAASPGRIYDISPDGQRFLVLKPATDPNTPPPQLIVVQHFDEELKRLVPAK
jgi:serine/threonine protein kinase/Tol biopolymer transport system component